MIIRSHRQTLYALKVISCLGKKEFQHRYVESVQPIRKEIKKGIFRNFVLYHCRKEIAFKISYTEKLNFF